MWRLHLAEGGVLFVAVLVCCILTPGFGGSANAAGADLQSGWSVAGPDGVWSSLLGPSGRSGHSVVVDPDRGRMIVFGGDDGIYHNDVWSVSMNGTPAWTELHPTGTPPPARANHSAIYDPVRNRMLVFGGAVQYVGYVGDVWSLALGDSPEWTQIVAAGPQPPVRCAHTATYDPVGDRMIVLGGLQYGMDPYLNDVWALALSGTPEWSELGPPGTPPAPRFGHTAIYDPLRHRIVMFGGYGSTGPMNDVHELVLGNAPMWSPLATWGPSPVARYYHAAIYDPARDRMVIFGGEDAVHYVGPRDTWALRLATSPEDPPPIALTWTELSPSGPVPDARYNHGMVCDAASDRLLVFWGFSPGKGWKSDLCALSLGAAPQWCDLTAAGPGPRAQHAAVYDIPRQRLVVFGGEGSGLLNDVWSLSLATGPVWSPIAPSGVAPPARAHHVAIYDPPNDRMIVFGGDWLWDDTWSLALGGSPQWTELHPTGGPPAGRGRHAAVYDAARHRMLVFGGYTYTGGGAFLNDVWALSLDGEPAWVQIVPSGAPGAPAPREGACAIYDPDDDRMLVFGGNDSLADRSDTWALELSGAPQWHLVAPDGSGPAGRMFASAIHDRSRARMVVHGGSNRDGYLGDVWALSLGSSLMGTSTWSQLAPAGASPSPRGHHAAVYDPVRDQMCVFGGYGGAAFSDTWLLRWTDAPTPTLIRRFDAEVHERQVLLRWEFSEPARLSDLRLERAEAAGPWAARETGALSPVAGTYVDATVEPGRSYRYRLAAVIDGTTRATFGPVKVEVAGIGLERGLVGVSPNPASGTAWVDFVMSRPDRVRITVMDVSGRVIETLLNEVVSAGRHHLEWKTGQGRLSYPAGLYFVRWESAGIVMQRRVSIVR